jgi:hypothetical protein
MATVTISAEDLQSVYSQLNFLRNYVGVWSLDWQEHVVTAAPVVAVPAAAAVATSVAVNAASVAVPATSKPTVAAAIGSPIAKTF